MNWFIADDPSDEEAARDAEWAQQESVRRFFEDAQQLLKADAEAYWDWCQKVEREFKERERA
jgi:hypothetical protein